MKISENKIKKLLIEIMDDICDELDIKGYYSDGTLDPKNPPPYPYLAYRCDNIERLNIINYNNINNIIYIEIIRENNYNVISILLEDNDYYDEFLNPLKENILNIFIENGWFKDRFRGNRLKKIIKKTNG